MSACCMSSACLAVTGGVDNETVETVGVKIGMIVTYLKLWQGMVHPHAVQEGFQRVRAALTAPSKDVSMN